jgi:ABC-type transporter Mla subunit MlaD
MAEGRPGLDVGGLLNWPVAMLNEVAALPDTLKAARRLVNDLAVLTDNLAQTVDLLGRTIRRVDQADLAGVADRIAAVTSQVETQIGEMFGPITHTVNQVDSIEASVTELRNTLFGILRRVPGARRSLLDLASPGARAQIEPGDQL